MQSVLISQPKPQPSPGNTNHYQDNSWILKETGNGISPFVLLQELFTMILTSCGYLEIDSNHNKYKRRPEKTGLFQKLIDYDLSEEYKFPTQVLANVKLQMAATDKRLWAIVFQNTAIWENKVKKKIVFFDYVPTLTLVFNSLMGIPEYLLQMLKVYPGRLTTLSELCFLPELTLPTFVVQGS